jgi:triacylglycerol lipase
MSPRLAVLAAALTLSALAAAPAQAAEPALTVGPTTLNRALHCVGAIDHAKRTPIMLVTGTGASGAEAYAIGKGGLDAYGAPVCYVDYPNYTTADVQVSVQYLVNGLRVMARRAGRQVAVFGISQGGLLPRVALTYWPSLRAKVSDVIAAAGTQHGTVLGDRSACATPPGCIPAGWQQAAGSKFLAALNAQPDETPGPTSWTTVRSSSDGTVQPQTGPHPTSALDGATNVLIQAVCPGRAVSHIGTALDSVTFALIDDAMTHAGPARVSRLPADVCAHPYAPGLDEATTTSLLTAAGGLTGSRSTDQPRVTREPKVRAWAKARVAAKAPAKDR